ncbi:MAG: ribonuclease III [Prolixibacteraceae bacterium]|nr:ribonuclease III [Prolixibacteraceae bacterium]MBT6007472.1 ribonuclease III [Prolixibacteraceae bacterium]MBT6766529.1 ribonuclease III [Prolixibacteraceae bacterium]MBT6998391.1 ribonuclease III [Prolixibacteraceae bacterium]MBT7397396.1 ribonuclease III [Prolixibacteraceae bacterium]
MIKKIVQRIKLFSSSRKGFYLFLKNIIGFYPENLKLYDLAFIHKSASTIDSQGNFINNERLEFLGDAILGAIIAEFLYNRFPQEDEGFLTKTRSKLVNRTFLTKLTFEMGLNVFIDSNTTKNIDKSHIYGDALEALIGAIYLDTDYKTAKFFVTKKILSQFVDLNEIEQNDSNFKSQLIEWSQKNKKEIIFETIEEPMDKSRQPKFVAIVELDNKEIGKGIGSSKKEAQQNAARQTLKKLEHL